MREIYGPTTHYARELVINTNKERENPFGEAYRSGRREWSWRVRKSTGIITKKYMDGSLDGDLFSVNTTGVCWGKG